MCAFIALGGWVSCLVVDQKLAHGREWYKREGGLNAGTRELERDPAAHVLVPLYVVLQVQCDAQWWTSHAL